MNKNELICELALELPQSTVAPEWFMYAPGGAARSWPSLGGKAVGEVIVHSDKATAEALQRDLTAIRAEGGPQPYFDFDHAGGAKSAVPLEFAWRDGATPGVYVRVRWTRRGSRSVTRQGDQEAEYTHFSPRCKFDRATGRITGLFSRAEGLAAGGLVNDPAFETISPLTAAKAAAQAADQTQTETPMKKEMIAALVTAGLLANEAEAGKDNAHELVATRAKELKEKAEKADKQGSAGASPHHDDAEAKELKASLAKMETELKAMRERAADKFVQELCASGKIPPAAEGIRKMWRASHIADSTQAEKDAKELTAAKALNTQALTDDTDATDTGATPDPQRVLAKANELVASKAYPNIEAAWEHAVSAVKAA